MLRIRIPFIRSLDPGRLNSLSKHDLDLNSRQYNRRIQSRETFLLAAALRKEKAGAKEQVSVAYIILYS